VGSVHFESKAGEGPFSVSLSHLVWPARGYKMAKLDWGKSALESRCLPEGLRKLKKACQ